MLLGIYERCTPALSSQVGMMAATLASFAETQQMLAEQGNELNIKTVRLLAYRAAERARMAQRMGDEWWSALMAGVSVCERRSEGQKPAKGEPAIMALGENQNSASST